MRLMKMKSSTFLVCKKGLNTEALFIPATGFLCCHHIADQIQRLLILLGPTTQHHDGTIRLACDMDVLDLDQAAWFETRPQGSEAKCRSVPRRRRAHGRAAGVGPARLMQRGLQCRPVELAVPQKDHLGPRGEHLAHHLDHGDVEIFRKVALRSVAHPPRQWEGATFVDDIEHQRGTPAAHAAAIHDEHHRLQSEMTQQDLRIGQKVHLLQDVSVVEPSGKAFDAALGLGAIGDLRGNVGEWAALAAHDAADKRRQGVEMSGEVPVGGGGIALRECIAYGTIASEVVTHRMLLQMCFSLTMEYTMGEPLKRPFHNNLEKCKVVKSSIRIEQRSQRAYT